MFETVVIATDGSQSAQRAVRLALDFADRFDATVHALYVLDTGELDESPADVRSDLEDALDAAGGEALSYVEEHAIETADQQDVVTGVRKGDPASEIIDYAEEYDADVIATGTRGRHGDHAFLLGSVAEAIVRRSPIPVLTVRQLSDEEMPS
ncbi:MULTISPECIES: universal stress protein [Salinibaculum]|uniref:universal stress protein n=1 Tax=Salinibaculum TaxID=2732368 RepID=UPI0030CFBADA